MPALLSRRPLTTRTEDWPKSRCRPTHPTNFGQTEIVRALLDAGVDPDRYNPPGGHSHATPWHQAAGFGHEDVVRLLVERGARLDLKDVLWHATPAEWAAHQGKTGIAAYLRERQTQPRPGPKQTGPKQT